MATASDNFTRANEDPLSGGGNWATMDISRRFQVVSNAATVEQLADDSAQIWSTAVNAFGADQFSQADVTQASAGTGSGFGVCVRASGTTFSSHNEYRLVVGTGGIVELDRCVSGSFTSLHQWSGVTYVAGATLRLEVSGTTLTAKYNGVTLGTVTDSSLSTGNPGVSYSSTASSGSLANWSGGDLAVAPINTVAPAVTGTAIVGYTLSTTNGTWTDDGSPTFTYQWQRDNNGRGSYSNIASATSSTYALVALDQFCNVRCVVTDTDSTGATQASSNSVGVTVVPVISVDYSAFPKFLLVR